MISYIVGNKKNCHIGRRKPDFSSSWKAVLVKSKFFNNSNIDSDLDFYRPFYLIVCESLVVKYHLVSDDIRKEQSQTRFS